MKRRIAYILIFIFLGLYALLVGGTMPYFLLYTYSLFFLIPLVHLRLILRGLDVNIKIPKGSLYVGDEIDLVYQLDNRTIFHIPHLEIHSHISKELSRKASSRLVENLAPYENYSYQENLDLNRRGYFQLGSLEIKISDAFGLFTLRRSYSSQASLVVYPKPIEISSFALSSVEQMGDLPIEDLTFQDTSRISSLREFRPGDSIKSVHWKLSAKLDEIIVKEYEKRGDAEVALFIDNYKDYFIGDETRDLEDRLVDLGLALVNYYIGENIAINLYSQTGGKLVQLETSQSLDLKNFLEFFAYFRADGHAKLEDLILANLENLTRDMTLIIITPILDRDRASLGIYLKSQGLQPIFIVSRDEEARIDPSQAQVHTSFKEEAIPLYLLDSNRSIKEVLEGGNR